MRDTDQVYDILEDIVSPFIGKQLSREDLELIMDKIVDQLEEEGFFEYDEPFDLDE